MSVVLCSEEFNISIPMNLN